MDSTRRGSGPGALAAALASQVHPVFMLPPLAASLLGGLLAGELVAAPATLHVVAMFLAVYTAHLKDGYVDFHVRGEDDDHPLTAGGCRRALLVTGVAFAGMLGALWAVAGLGAAAITAPAWLIGYLHAPQFDTAPVTATAGYPVGIALCLLGGYHVQSGSLAAAPVALAAVLVLVLCGVKIVDDAQDLAFDRSIEKRTVPVVLGRGRARRLAGLLMGAGLLGVVAAAATGVLPRTTALAAIPFALVAALAAGREPRVATALLVRGAYLLLAVVVAAVGLDGVG